MNSDTEIQADESEDNRVGKLVLPSDDEIWNSRIREIIDLRVEDAKCLLQILGSWKNLLKLKYLST